MLLLDSEPQFSEQSGFFRGCMDDCVCTVFSWVMVVCPEPFEFVGVSRSARSAASGLKLVRIACSIRFLSNRSKSIIGVSGAGGTTSPIFSIFTWKYFRYFPGTYAYRWLSRLPRSRQYAGWLSQPVSVIPGVYRVRFPSSPGSVR